MLEESECWSLMAHMGLSSRKRCLFLEGESKILLEYRLLPFRKGVWTSRGRVQKVQGGHTGNPTLLSVLSLVVVDWRKACQEGQLSNVREGGRKEGGKEA